MDALLNQVTNYALNYAIRSGISVTGGYALKQCSRLIKTAPRGSGKDDLRHLQSRLENKIRIISPAIDMIELIAARGNTTLESAVQLTKDIRYDIQALGTRLASAATDQDLFNQKSKRAKSRQQIELELTEISISMRRLLTRIEDAVPLMNLAITTSGVNLTTNLPATVSPSRLLQASTLLTAADTDFTAHVGQASQVGPTYVLSVYMLFAGHASRPQDDDNIRAETWKEVMHKARVRLARVPQSQLYELPSRGTDDRLEVHELNGDDIPAEQTALDFSYQLILIEDLDDGRVHTFDDPDHQPGSFEDVQNAGIRDVIPVHQISKIFYADTGKLLNIASDGETNSPVLLLKRDVNAVPPRRMIERQGSFDAITPTESTDGLKYDEDEEQSQIDAQIEREKPSPQGKVNAVNDASDQWRLPADLDPEWIALEVFTEEIDIDSDDESESLDGADTVISPSARHTRESSTTLSEAFASMDIQERPEPILAPIKASLSLLEMLVRLTALQQFRQASHLSIEDELLNFFLSDSSTTGAGANADYRQRVRRDARRRLGFDPYDESPLKKRSEEYIAHANASPMSSAAGMSTPAHHPPPGFSSPVTLPPLLMREENRFLRGSSPLASSPPLSFNGAGTMPSPSIFKK